MILSMKNKYERLLQSLDLTVGDVISVCIDGANTEMFEVETRYIIRKLDDNIKYGIAYLLTCDFEKIGHGMLFSDAKCCDIPCAQCPLRNLVHNRDNCKDLTLLERLRSIRHNLSDEEYNFYAKLLTAHKSSDLFEERK